jgi:hypothetical protein
MFADSLSCIKVGTILSSSKGYPSDIWHNIMFSSIALKHDFVANLRWFCGEGMVATA